jgi:choline transport protein
MAESSTLRRRSVETATEGIELKGPQTVLSADAKGDVESDSADYNADQDGWGDTDADLRDMRRLGKKQEFKRNFSFWSTLGFVSIYMATWEFVLVSLSVGLANGGFAGLFWCFITTVICYGFVVASLAEMESMAPTSGGQYHCK